MMIIIKLFFNRIHTIEDMEGEHPSMCVVSAKELFPIGAVSLEEPELQVPFTPCKFIYKLGIIIHKIKNKPFNK